MRNRLKGGCWLYAPSPKRWLPARRAALAGEWRVGGLEPARIVYRVPQSGRKDGGKADSM